jgi:hypothetical protein
MWAGAACLAVGTLASAQTRDAQQVLAEARTALGGKTLDALTALAATGKTQRSMPDGRTTESEFELSLALPDKYLMRSVRVAMGSMSIYANSGFNGDQVIEEIDTPPNLGGGHMVIRMAGPGGPVDPAKMTPEQKAEFDKARLLTNRKEYAKLALGLFAASPATYPLEFTYAGEAEAADGKADVIDVKGAGDFTVRLFIDRQTHLPLMLSWQDKEPVVIQMGGPGTSFSAGGASATTRVVQGGGPMSPEDRQKLDAEMDAKRKEAEAKRRVVEFRVYYADYQDVGGVKLPHRLQRAIDGKTVEELVFDEFKVNPKIDARKFQPANK